MKKQKSLKAIIAELDNSNQYNTEPLPRLACRNGKIVPCTPGYDVKYDQLAYETMQEPDASVSRLCAVLHVNMPRLQEWLRKYPSFRQAVESGRLIGEDAFRKKVYEHAFRPSSGVNNSLIKLIADDVHGIGDESKPLVVIQNNQYQAASQDESSQVYADVLKEIEEGITHSGKSLNENINSEESIKPEESTITPEGE